MRFSSKIALGYFLFFAVAGVVLGAIVWARIPSMYSFTLIFILLTIAGAVPASFVALFGHLRKTWAKFLLAAVYVAIPCGAIQGAAIYRNAYEKPVDQGPYLSWTEDPKTTMTVSWTTVKPVSGAVEYAREGQATFLRAGEDQPAQFHHVTLKHLEPGTCYQYRVPDLGAKPFTFETAPASPENFTFAVYGDSRPTAGLSRHAAIVNQMLAQDKQTPYKFVIHTGDIVENPGQGFGWQWHSFLDNIIPLADTRPFMVVLGNHEARGDGKETDEYMHVDEGHFWYAFDYAGVHFIGLSTEADIAPGSEQHQWLVNDLEKHAAGSRFVVVALHKPLATYDPRDSYRGTKLRGKLEPTFKKYGVSVVFAGHVHSYEHLRLDGFDEVTTGGGGVLLWSKPVVGPLTVKTETIWHFCTVVVNNDTMRITARRIDGSVIEAFDIPARKN